MADKIPLKAHFNIEGSPISLGEYEPNDWVPIQFGGTGASNAIAARANLGAASQIDVSNIGSAFSSHAADLGIHFVINDSGTNANEVWSSFKTSGELASKSNNGHTHDDRYYTETEINLLFDGIEDKLVSVSANDSTPGYLVDKIVAGQGVFLSTQAQSSNEQRKINAQVFITQINGYDHPVYLDSSKGGKILSVATHQFTWAEANVSDNEWLSIGTATDSLTGHIIPFDATIIGGTIHSENGADGKDINLYVDGVLTTTLVTMTSGEISISGNNLNIDVSANSKLRIRAGGAGPNAGDTVVMLYVKWRVS